MTLDEIKENAPDGATHYQKNRNGVLRYFKKDNKQNWMSFDCLNVKWINGKWHIDYGLQVKPL